MAVEKKAKKKNKSKVWHIKDFRELFELPDDLRKNRPGPLSYTKSFVTLTGFSKEYEIKHFERLQELKSRPERHLLRSIFEEIKNWSAKKIIKHRGFLITTEEQPASYEYLAVQLGIDVEELRKGMPLLEEIGLIELANMDTLPGVKKLTKNAKKQKTAIKKARKKSTHKKNPNGKECEAPDESGTIRTNPAAAGTIRTNPAAAGTKRTALYNDNLKRKIKLNGNGKKKEEIKKRQKKIKRIIDDHHAGKLKTQTKSATTNPDTPQPTLPRKSANAEGRVIEFPVVPPLAVRNSFSSEKHRYAPDCIDFAGDIYQALGLTFSPLSVRGRREIGCFGSVWERAKMAGLPPNILEDLRHKAVAEAAKLSKRRERCGKVGAVFCHIFSRLLGASCAGTRTGLEVCG